MSGFDGGFEINDHMFKSTHNYMSLPGTALGKIQELDFPFEEYKANLKLVCFPYHRALQQCVNNYGIQGAWKNPKCQRMVTLFYGCVDNHTSLARIKKYWPEKMANGQWHDKLPSNEDIFD